MSRQTLGQRANEISRRVFGRPVGQIAPASGPLRVTPNPGKPLDRAHIPQYWHPDRLGVEQAPADFTRRLHAIKDDLYVVRPPPNAPVLHCWYLWQREPQVTHALCPGWSLKMAWKFANTPLPLDEKFFAALWHFDPRNCGGAVEHFDRLIAENNRVKEAKEKQYRDRRWAEQREWFKTRRISTAGRGNRFARHHDGTIFPTRQEVNWEIANRETQMPSEQLRAERDEIEKSRS
jgi:hypothetical protein